MRHPTLVVYGTLLNAGSLDQTVGNASALRKRIMPVIVKDHRRLFNVRPEHYEPSFKISRASVEVAALNVEPAVGLHFNGLAIPVTSDELQLFDERERYYERLVIPFCSFETNEPIGEGCIYLARRNSRWVHNDLIQLLPRWEDIELARTGAYEIGEAFGRMFDETTSMPDGVTLVIDAYRDYLHGRDLNSSLSSRMW